MTTPLVQNPADALVYAPDLPREYEPSRAPWTPRLDGKLVVSVLLHAPAYRDTRDGSTTGPQAMVGGVGRETGEPRHGQVARLSQWDFGLTTGLYRLLDIAERAGAPCAVAVDAYGLHHMPGLAQIVAERSGEIVARGRAANDILHSAMSPQQENDYVASSLSAVRAFTGRTVSGWFSPERATTPATPSLLARHGLTWFGEWPVDERPVPLPGAGICALPFALETEDMFALYTRGLRTEDYADLLERTLTVLVRDAQRVGTRFLGLSWFGWVLGQACFANVAARFLGRLMEHPDIHVVLPSDVVRAQ